MPSISSGLFGMATFHPACSGWSRFIRLVRDGHVSSGLFEMATFHPACSKWPRFIRLVRNGHVSSGLFGMATFHPACSGWPRFIRLVRNGHVSSGLFAMATFQPPQLFGLDSPPCKRCGDSCLITACTCEQNLLRYNEWPLAPSS